jgi:tRNA (mo5U34)-methyltransferase
VNTAAFEPLPQLKTAEDWQAFIQSVQGGSYDRDRLAVYRKKAIVRENALPHILTVLDAAAQGGKLDKLLAVASETKASIKTREVRPSELRTLTSLATDLSDTDLAELNAILPWHAWVADGKGRAFGSSFSGHKRALPDAIPDPRIVELDRLVSLKTKSVLEVGCFEGIHTTALCDLAQHVKACDVRVSLIVKTSVRCTFMGARPELFLWNAEEELPARDVSADVLHHVGVLYHLKDPVTHLRRLLPKIGEAFLLDTHVAVPQDELYDFEADGKVYRTRRYKEGGVADPFSGVHDHSNWLLLDDLIGLAGEYGFTEILVNRVSDQRNGPRVTLIARRPR